MSNPWSTCPIAILHPRPQSRHLLEQVHCKHSRPRLATTTGPVNCLHVTLSSSILLCDCKFGSSYQYWRTDEKKNMFQAIFSNSRVEVYPWAHHLQHIIHFQTLILLWETTFYKVACNFQVSCLLLIVQIHSEQWIPKHIITLWILRS